MTSTRLFIAPRQRHIKRPKGAWLVFSGDYHDNWCLFNQSSLQIEAIKMTAERSNDLPYYPGRDTNTSLPLTNAYRPFSCSSRWGCRQPWIQISRSFCHRVRECAMFSWPPYEWRHIEYQNNWIWLDATRSCRRTTSCMCVHQALFPLDWGCGLRD